jgi:hypothetical protein
MSLGAGFGGANALVKDIAGVLHVVTGVGNGVFLFHMITQRRK